MFPINKPLIPLEFVVNVLHMFHMLAFWLALFIGFMFVVDKRLGADIFDANQSDVYVCIDCTCKAFCLAL
jgi:hypothetical protein